MRIVLEALATPSAMLAGGILLYSIFLIVFRNFLKKKNKAMMLWRLLCLVPLPVCLIHGLAYNLGKQELVALGWFGVMYVDAVLIALWQFVEKRKILQRIAASVIVTVSAFNLLYVAAVIPIPSHLHNFTYQSWTDSFISTVHAMEEEYPISDWKGIDYDALLEEFVPRIQEAEENQDTIALGVVLYDYCSRFYDGHVSVEPGDGGITQYINAELLGNDYGVSMITLDNGNVVAIDVEPGSEAETAGIHIGTVITAWDGIPVEEAKYSYHYPMKQPVEDNEEPARTMLLAAQGGDSVEVSFISDTGEEKNVFLSCIGEYMVRYMKVYSKFSHMVESDENFSYKMISDTCGYLRIHSEELNTLESIYGVFTNEAPFVTERVDEILEFLRIKGMTTLVIDIRNNTGGNAEVGPAIASLFAENECTYFWMSDTRGSDGRYEKREPYIVKANGKWKDLPVVVLTNQNTVSGGDCLS